MDICVCDDDLKFIKQMCGLLQELVPGNHLLSFTSGFEMLDYIQRESENIDILFLDMEMPGLNGLQTAAELRKSHPHMSVAVVTSYPKYAIASYNFSPIHYILKPISADRIQSCIDRVKINKDVLLIKTRDGIQYIPLCEIYALESRGLQVSIKLKWKQINVYKTLTSYETVLIKNGFYRIHSGAIINMDYITFVNGNAVTLTNNQVFYVSRRKKTEFMNALLKWRKAYA